MAAAELTPSFSLNTFHNPFPLLSCHSQYLINNRIVNSGIDDHCQRVSWLAPVPESQEEQVCNLGECPRKTEEGEKQSFLPPQEGKDDRWGQDSGDTLLSSEAIFSGSSYIQRAATGWQRGK